MREIEVTSLADSGPGTAREAMSVRNEFDIAVMRLRIREALQCRSGVVLPTYLACAIPLLLRSHKI